MNEGEQRHDNSVPTFTTRIPIVGENRRRIQRNRDRSDRDPIYGSIIIYTLKIGLRAIRRSYTVISLDGNLEIV